ncbi:MAG: metallopeptidase family protein [Candidatus Limnocylindrales bacterium]
MNDAEGTGPRRIGGLAAGWTATGGPRPRASHDAAAGATGDDALEAIVIQALDRLPTPFRDRLGSVAIVIEDEATAEQLATVGARGLFGLYQGVPRTAYGADQAAVPSKITLFRGPLMRAYRTPERLEAGVTDTVYHEIAHHFGISDARLHELQGGR